MAHASSLVYWRLTRSTSSMPDAETIRSRSATFAAACKTYPFVTLLAVGTPNQVSDFVITPHAANADQATHALAVAIGADRRRVPDEEVPDLSRTRVVGKLVVNASESVGRDSQIGADPAELPRAVASALRTFELAEDDSPTWIAVSMRAPRKPRIGRGERDRHRAWIEHRLNAKVPTHHTLDLNAMVVSIYAGGENAQEVHDRLAFFAAAVRGFDLPTKVRILHQRHPALGLGAVAVASGSVPFWLEHALALPVAASVAGAAAVSGGLIGANVVKLRAARSADACRSGEFVKPGVRRGHVAAPVRRTVSNGEEGAFKEIDRAGTYPLPDDAFLMAPHLIVGTVAPHAGVATGAAVVSSQSAPPELLDSSIGPMFGAVGQQNVPLFLASSQMYGGVLWVGRQGSGKSVSMRWLFANVCLDRTSPVSFPGGLTQQTAAVVFEKKGEDSRVWQQWATAAGDKTLVMDIFDPSTYAIDIFAVPGSLEYRARFFAAMMQYVFDEGDIRGRSLEALIACFAGGLVVTDDMLTDLPAVRKQMSPLYYTHILLGSLGDETAVALNAIITSSAMAALRAGDDRAEDLTTAMNHLLPYFGKGGTPSSRRSLTEAARNKIGQMMGAEAWFSVARKKVTWERILTQHRSVVINSGTTPSGVIADHIAGDMMSAMLTFSLKDAIERNCSGWRAQRRAVTIWCDEVSLLAGTSPDIIRWLHDQGRSYGVVPLFATQRLDQLSYEVVASIEDYATKIWLRNSNVTAAEMAARYLSSTGDEVKSADVMNLEMYAAYVQTVVGDRVQPAVIAKMPDAERDMAAMIETARASRPAGMPGTHGQFPGSGQISGQLSVPAQGQFPGAGHVSAQLPGQDVSAPQSYAPPAPGQLLNPDGSPFVPNTAYDLPQDGLR